MATAGLKQIGRFSVTTVVMVCFGLIMVYSASSVWPSSSYHSSGYFLYRPGASGQGCASSR